MNDREVRTNIEKFVFQSNQLFLENKFEQAALKSQNAYELIKTFKHLFNEEIKQKVEFNLASIYTASGNYKQAKTFLDYINGHEIAFEKKAELAILYTKLAQGLEKSPECLKECYECYELAGYYLAKEKDWSQYCKVQMMYAKLLSKNNLYEESTRITNKILAVYFHINDEIEMANIYLNLSSIYARDVKNKSNIELCKKLLLRSYEIVETKTNSANNELLKLRLYLNLSGICNILETYEDTLKFTTLALEKSTSPTTEKSQRYLSDIKYNEGYALYHLGQINKSIEAFNQSHSFSLKTQSNSWQSLEAIAFLYCKLRDYKQGKYYIEQALTYLNEQKDESHGKEFDSAVYKQNETRLLLKKKNLEYFFETEDEKSKNLLVDLMDKENEEKLDEAKTSLDNDDQLDSKSDDLITPKQQKIEEKGLINDLSETKIERSGVGSIENPKNSSNDSKSDNSENITSNTTNLNSTDLGTNESHSFQVESKKLSKYSPIIEESEMENEITKKTDIALADTSKNLATESVVREEKHSDNKPGTKKFKSPKRRKFYKDFNQGSVINHPENREDGKEENESKTCVIL